MLKYLIAFVLLSSSAFAQQQVTPPEAALQINRVVGEWAQTIVQQGKAIDELQKQLKDEQAKNKELESKLKDGSTPAK